MLNISDWFNFAAFERAAVAVYSAREGQLGDGEFMMFVRS